MEMGTIDNALLRNHSAGTEGCVSGTETLSRVGAGSTFETMLFFVCRWGEVVSDGGHMVVPSIGQAIPSSTNDTSSVATERSGNAHIVPIT